MIMKTASFLILLLVIPIAGPLSRVAAQSSKPRVIAMTDGEVDDRCSMVRFLLHTNDMELLAIIQTNSVFQGSGWSSDRWIEQQIDAYGQVYPNLRVHDPDYPSPDELRSMLVTGDEDPSHLGVDRDARGRIPGDEPAIDPSGWADTPGSDRIVEILLEEDPRPVYIQAWGGGNTAARAFHQLKTKFPEEYDRAVSKAVMYNIWYQDGAGSYIERYHPGVTMLLSHYFSGTWDYGSQRYTYRFIEDYVHNNHGPLGKLYVQDYISEGDSPAFLHSLANGLRSHEDPSYGGWGGRFYKVDGFENVYRDVDKGSYMRWIEYANREFESRLRWCVAGTYGEANHRPEIEIRGGLDRTVTSGETVELEAAVSDPDPLDIDALWEQNSVLYEQAGLDKERFSEHIVSQPRYSLLWWQYAEAGTCDHMVHLPDPRSASLRFTAPEVDKPETIHLILEATDRGTPALTSFARVIVTVLPNSQ